MGEKGTQHAVYEAATWPVLEELTKNHPECGIHFQGK